MPTVLPHSREGAVFASEMGILLGETLGKTSWALLLERVRLGSLGEGKSRRELKCPSSEKEEWGLEAGM